ncbi:invasion associated locus B family protein [Pararhodobacter sp.]|uniref:invasion associated locus B family protein n=1 Tax=Pararhodobacter sp. TaxID=2127056 RepID=UPI002AFE83CB|nr:invasion associated locus B family protein [Pararhodobacter sp.]
MAASFKFGAAGLALALVASGLTGGVAVAQESTNRVAVETAWSVFVDGNPRECWAVSAPSETVNTRDGRAVSVRRGDILMFATYRQGQGAAAEISFTGGYPFAEGSTIEMTIGTDTYQLFTDGEWGWAASPAEDARILAAMRRGQNAVLVARSSRGTQTQDTFSLFGLTAATEEAQRRCAQ